MSCFVLHILYECSGKKRSRIGSQPFGVFVVFYVAKHYRFGDEMCVDSGLALRYQLVFVFCRTVQAGIARECVQTDLLRLFVLYVANRRGFGD